MTGIGVVLAIVVVFTLYGFLVDAVDRFLSWRSSGVKQVEKAWDRWREPARREVAMKISKPAAAAPPAETDMNELTGLAFEEHVASLLYAAGFSDVRRTPPSNDQGADLLARKNGSLIVVQTKRYKGPVGNRAVQEVAAALRFYDGHEAWVVTNSTFTPAAEQLAKKIGVRLIDGAALPTLPTVMPASPGKWWKKWRPALRQAGGRT